MQYMSDNDDIVTSKHGEQGGHKSDWYQMDVQVWWVIGIIGWHRPFKLVLCCMCKLALLAASNCHQQHKSSTSLLYYCANYFILLGLTAVMLLHPCNTGKCSLFSRLRVTPFRTACLCSHFRHWIRVYTLHFLPQLIAEIKINITLANIDTLLSLYTPSWSQFFMHTIRNIWVGIGTHGLFCCQWELVSPKICGLSIAWFSST